MSTNKDNNFMEKFGLNVQNGDVEVGATYPLYAMITNILDDTPGNVLVELNFSIIANLNLPTQEKVEIIKGRAFEPGIFVSTIINKDSPKTTVDCHTIIFGKRKDNFDC